MTDSAARPAIAPKRRVPFWDNARFVAITLVVIGHGIQRLNAESDYSLIVYVFIYAFHIPAFAMISGYFSKARPPGSRQMKKVLTDILLPYLIMETIWSLVQFLVEGKKDFNPTTPSWTLWFLLALGIFRLVLPYLALLRWPLLWVVLFSLAVAYFDNVDSTFSLSRAIGIMPFFVLGWQVRQWRLVERWHVAGRAAWLVRVGAVLVLGGWLAVVVVFISQFRAGSLQHWFYYDDSYRSIGDDQWWAGLVRFGFMLLAVLLSAAFFALIPRRQTWITDLGKATMYVYLLHSFVLYPLRQTGVISKEHASIGWLVAVIIACVAISIVLASPLVRRIFRRLVEPKPRWLFITLPDEPRGLSRTDPTGSRRDTTPRSARPTSKGGPPNDEPPSA